MMSLDWRKPKKHMQEASHSKIASQQSGHLLHSTRRPLNIAGVMGSLGQRVPGTLAVACSPCEGPLTPV